MGVHVGVVCGCGCVGGCVLICASQISWELSVSRCSCST